MTPALLDMPASLLGSGARETERGRGTLEEVLNDVLHETRTIGAAECPLCHARVRLARAHAECTGCGSRLS